MLTPAVWGSAGRELTDSLGYSGDYQASLFELMDRLAAAVDAAPQPDPLGGPATGAVRSYEVLSYGAAPASADATTPARGGGTSGLWRWPLLVVALLASTLLRPRRRGMRRPARELNP